MRPLELTLEGFKSYRDKVTFTFEGRSLFGVVGPTGSGKSSILDGLIFCLFGKTPRLERDTKRLINSLSDEARMQLAFEVDEKVWKITRVMRRQGASQVVLESEDEAQFTGDRVATEKVGELLGLDFDAFCASVSLPQGDFDRFLRASPGEQSRILKGIFRLDRVDALRQSAKARSAEAEGSISSLRMVIQGLPEDPEAKIKETETKLAESRRDEDEIRDRLPAVTAAELEVGQTQERLANLRVKSKQIEDAIAKIPPILELEEFADAYERAEKARDETSAAVEALQRRMSSAEAAHSELIASSGGQQWLVQMAERVRDSDRLRVELADSAALNARLSDEAKTSEENLKKKRGVQAAAESAAKKARAALEELNRHHSAHFLREGLSPGDPCPVCDRPIDALPKMKKPTAITSAQKLLKKAEDELSDAIATTLESERHAALSADRITEAQKRGKDIEQQLRTIELRISELLADGMGVDGAPTELERRRKLLADSETTLKSVREEWQDAEQKARATAAVTDSLVERRLKLVSAMSAVTGRLGLEAPTDADPAGLIDVAKRAMDESQEMLNEVERETTAISERGEAARQVLVDFRQRFGLSDSQLVADALAEVKQRISEHVNAIEQLRKSIQKRREIDVELLTLAKKKALFDRLVDDLTDRKFPSYLLEAQRRLLSKIASEKLVDLTGHYSFDEGGEFQIVDRRTGDVRSPQTLSGGETFLASLSLALALAEAVSLEGGQLGCFFLDEGFGSLDSESLDLALEGIEALAVPGRLIGLISHVPGMQARLEDLIVLERDADGSTIVVQQEGPLGYSIASI